MLVRELCGGGSEVGWDGVGWGKRVGGGRYFFELGLSLRHGGGYMVVVVVVWEGKEAFWELGCWGFDAKMSEDSGAGYRIYWRG